MSSLTRIPLDSANVDIISGLTKSVLKFYVSQDIVNSVYEIHFRNTAAEIADTNQVNTGRETMEHSSTSYIGITTKMERYCARFALILEVLRYTCGQSDLTAISAQSMKDAFKLTYYFIAGAQKALKKFHSDPLGTLRTLHQFPQPQNAENATGVYRITFQP